MINYISPKQKKGKYAGLSTDEKPLTVQNGSVYFEMDTGLYYMFDAEGKEWYVQEENGGGGGGGTTDHSKLVNRNKPNQHPMSAITGLNEKVDEIENKDAEQDNAINELSLKKADKKPIPADWEAKVRTYTALFNNTDEIDTFLFFSDPHYWGFADSIKTMEKSLDGMKSVYDRAPCTFCLCGGDWLTNGDTQVEACFKLGNIDGEVRSRFSDFAPVLGNHDTNYQGVDFLALTQATIDNLFFRQEGKAYYLYQTKTTNYYVLDTGIDWRSEMTPYRWEQIDWLATSLIADDAKHNVVVMHIALGETDHLPPPLSAESIKVINAYNSRSTLVSNGKTYDFSKVKGTVHCILGGHNHESYDTVIDGVPIILETCVMQGQAVSSTDYGYDICILDYKASMIHMVRFGEGTDRDIPIIEKGGTVIPPANIVRDGLVFYLDGLDRGAVPGIWADKIGGAKFKLSGGCTEIPNGVKFAGTGADSGAEAPNTTGFAVETSTIEFVYKTDKGVGIIYIPPYEGPNGQVMASCYDANYIFVNAYHQMYERKSQVSTLCTVSMNYIRGYENKVQIQKTSNDSWAPGVGITSSYLGRRSARGVENFQGTLYAIRIYNRILTEEEILQNQTDDLVRYAE